MNGPEAHHAFLTHRHNYLSFEPQPRNYDQNEKQVREPTLAGYRAAMAQIVSDVHVRLARMVRPLDGCASGNDERLHTLSHYGATCWMFQYCIGLKRASG